MIPVLYPMKADDDEKRLELAWDSPEWWAERKFDGARYLMRKENGEVRFVSRQKSKKTGLPVDKTENVPHLVELLSSRLPDGTVLDGEIITHENCKSNEVTKIMGALPEKAIERQEKDGYVKYVVFDCLYYNGHNIMERPYISRRELLEKLFQNGLKDLEYVLLAPVYKDNKREVYEQIVREGGEGVILKNIHSKYIPDKRPKNTWIKVKKYNTYDVIVVGYTEPTKEYKGKYPENWPYWEDGVPVTKDYYMGWIGAIRFGQYVPKKFIVEAGIPEEKITDVDETRDYYLIELGQTDGLSDEMKEFFTRNKDQMIGSVIEIGGMERTKDGAIRHPRFLRIREDKDPKECVWEG